MQRRTLAGHGNAAGVDCDEEPERTRKSPVWGTAEDTKIHSDGVLRTTRVEGERKST